MTAIEYLLLIVGLGVVYLIVDRLHNRWAIRSAIREANALRLLRRELD